jgi:hypothetical protein
MSPDIYDFERANNRFGIGKVTVDAVFIINKDGRCFAPVSTEFWDNKDHFAVPDE